MIVACRIGTGSPIRSGKAAKSLRARRKWRGYTISIAGSLQSLGPALPMERTCTMYAVQGAFVVMVKTQMRLALTQAVAPALDRSAFHFFKNVRRRRSPHRPSGLGSNRRDSPPA